MIRRPDVLLRAAVLPAAAMLALALFACGDDDNPATPSGPGPEGLVSDFSLPDVNPNSESFEEAVSPRDYLAKVSAWYFGHST